VSKSRLATGLGSLFVAFVAVVVLDANGIESAPLVVCGAALIAITVAAIVSARGL
jgi:hypothetical protein